MSNILLGVYTIIIKKSKSSQNTPLVLGKIDNTHLGKIFNSILTELAKTPFKDDTNSIQYKKSGIKGTTTRYSGIFSHGEYGKAKSIHDDRGKEKFFKDKHLSDAMPHYFLVDLPKNENIGYIIIQNTDRDSIYTLLKKFVANYFKLNYPDYVPIIGTYAQPEVVKEIFTSGIPMELTLTRYMLPKDRTDTLGGAFYDETKPIKIKYSLDPSSDVIKNKIIDDNGLIQIFNLDQSDSGGEKYISIEYGVKFRGKKRVVKLQKPENIRPFYDVTSEVVLDQSTNHPEINSIHESAINLLNEILCETIH